MGRVSATLQRSAIEGATSGFNVLAVSVDWHVERERAQLLTPEFMHAECVVRGRSSHAIARDMGVSRGTVDDYRKRYGIAPMKLGPNLRRYVVPNLQMFMDLCCDRDAY